MCCYCKHVTWGPNYRCEFHNANLPVQSAGTVNMICRDFKEGITTEIFNFRSQYAELEPHMHNGILYGFPYPSHNRPADLKEIMKFKE